MMSNALGIFSSRPDMSTAAKSGTPPMEGYRPTIPASVPPSAANPGALGTNEVSISQPGADTAQSIRAPKCAPIRALRRHRACCRCARRRRARPLPPPPRPPRLRIPNETAKQASMTPAQQKKAYKEALKKQTDAVKKAQSDRKKKEAQQAQAVKEQKKKSKEQQKQDPKPDAKSRPRPPAVRTQPPPAKQ